MTVICIITYTTLVIYNWHLGGGVRIYIFMFICAYICVAVNTDKWNLPLYVIDHRETRVCIAKIYMHSMNCKTCKTCTVVHLYFSSTILYNAFLHVWVCRSSTLYNQLIAWKFLWIELIKFLEKQDVLTSTSSKKLAWGYYVYIMRSCNFKLNYSLCPILLH